MGEEQPTLEDREGYQQETHFSLKELRTQQKEGTPGEKRQASFLLAVAKQMGSQLRQLQVGQENVIGIKVGLQCMEPVPSQTSTLRSVDPDRNITLADDRISVVHPPHEAGEDKTRSCVEFLHHFFRQNGKPTEVEQYYVGTVSPVYDR